MSTVSATPTPRRLIVGITGATGIVYGIRLLDALRDTDIETHLVMTRAAARTLAYEADISVEEVRARLLEVWGVEGHILESPEFVLSQSLWPT